MVDSFMKFSDAYTKAHGAIALGGLEFQHRLASAEAAGALLGQCRGDQVATQLFEHLPLTGAATQPGEQTGASCTCMLIRRRR